MDAFPVAKWLQKSVFFFVFVFKNKERGIVMTRTTFVQLAVALGLGLATVGCGGESEGPIVPPPPAPAEYADKHMPAGWWTDAAKAEEGRKLFIGDTNPDVNCASCHGKDGKPDNSHQDSCHR